MKDVYIARTSAVAARALGGSMVIMSPGSSLFTLNEVGTAIWAAADGRTPLSRIVEEAVCAGFDVEPAVARSDAESFVQRLAAQGLLIVSDQPIAGDGDK